MKNLPLLFPFLLLIASCQEQEVPTPIAAMTPPYLSWAEGDWWVYDWKVYNHWTGDTVSNPLDTTFALADTVINGETYRTLSKGIYPWSEQLHLRDSSGYVVDASGQIIYSYVNFTDTLINLLDSAGDGWFTKMYLDQDPTVVPAGVFNTINYRLIKEHFTVACGDSIIQSDRQFAENVGLVRMSYHYAAPGPCIDHVKSLVSYHIQ